MARDGNGVYSLPAGDVVTGTTISSTDFNNKLNDLETDANTDRPVAAGGTGASTAAGARTNLAAPHWVSVAGAPDADDDDSNTGGNGTFAEGSLWYDSTGDALYQCTDPSTGAAVWGAVSSALANIVEDTTPQLGGALDGQGYDVTGIGVLTMVEQAAAEADVAGNGQWWVQTATPNLPMFTNDAGTDFQLATLTGTETLTNKTLTAPAINVGSDATGDIYYRTAGGAFARLAAGSDSEVLTLASGVPSWAAAGGGATELVASATASASSSLAFTGLSSTYNSYLLTIGNLDLSTTATLYLRTSTDGGSSYDSGASNYHQAYLQHIAATVSGAASLSQTEIQLTGSAWGDGGTDGRATVTGWVKILNAADADYTYIQAHLFWYDFGSGMSQRISTGLRAANSDVDAFQILPSTGTMTIGEFRLYGLKDS